MKRLLNSLLVCIFCWSVTSYAQVETLDVSNLIVTPNHYIVTKAKSNIIIDGIANETAWKEASFTSSFIDIEGIKKPKYDTKVKMLWDDTYLYVYAELEEPHIWATLKQRDTIIFYNNDFEVFIDPSNATKNYGEIEINANNTVWDLHLDKPYRVSGKPNNHWDLKELKSAVKVYGTLNNATDTDTKWTVEMAIPLKAINELKGSGNIPKEGDFWRINFSRVEWDFDLIDGKYYRKKVHGKYLPEYNWVWSNQKVINMHEPEKWGYLHFSDDKYGTESIFNIGENVLLKQASYALFREASYGSLKKLNRETPGFTKTYEVTYDGNKKVVAIFTKTHFGFEFKVTNTDTSSIYVINEEGVLKLIKA